MPPRKKVKTNNTKTDVQNKPKGPQIASEGASQPVAVKARGGGRVKLGGLKNMLEMPLDVLFEIFRCLHPRDLLNLARTSKPFRALLMNKKDASACWTAARLQAEDIPPISPHLNEPAYASLLYSLHCHSCGKSGDFPLISDLFVRLCIACKKEKLVSCYNIDSLPGTLRAGELYCTFKDRNRNYHQYKPEIEAVLKGWRACKRAGEKKTYVEEREKYVERLAEYADLIQGWLDRNEEAKSQRREDAKAERFKAILSRLREAGWGQELDQMQPSDMERLADLKQVDIATRLGEKGWANIRDELIAFMTTIQRERHGREYVAKMTQRLNCLKDVLTEYRHEKWAVGAGHQLIAGIGDYANLPEVRAVLTDEDENVTLQSVRAKLSEILPATIEAWAVERTEAFVAQVRTSLGDTTAARSDDPLKLAVAIFRCRCDRYYSNRPWPEIMGHQCLWGRHSRQTEDQYEALVSRYIKLPGNEEASYNGAQEKSVTIEQDLPSVCEVIVACGLDPDTATPADIDSCNVRLRCRLCAQVVKQEVFSWRGAVAHDAQHHRELAKRDKESARRELKHWDRVTDEMAATVRALEGPYCRSRISKKAKDYGPYDYYLRDLDVTCSWCGCIFTSSIWDVKNHLLNKHNKKEPKVDVDFYIKDDHPGIWMYSDTLLDNESAKEDVKRGRGFFVSSPTL